MSKLKALRPVQVQVGSNTVIEPCPPLLENVSLLRSFLRLVVEDWHRAVQPYEDRIASGESDDFVSLDAMSNLHPVFLKCLFSYVVFFVSLDSAYEHVYSALNRANRTLRVPHAKPPHRTDLVKRAKIIRDISITHFPSEEVPATDALAAMSWSPMTLSKPTGGVFAIRNLTFGGFRLRPRDGSAESQNLEVSGLETLDQACTAYADAFDDLCAVYLQDLHSANGTVARV